MNKNPSLEQDILNSELIVEKVHKSSAYAQNLYAALCNNQFVKMPDDTPDGIVKILKSDNKAWSCSWRYAGGIIAEIRGQGDYMDWYCSGMLSSDSEFSNDEKYVGEGEITEEIRHDFLQLKWKPI